MQIGIPTTCLYNLVPNRIKMLSNKNVSASHTFDKNKHDIFRLLSENAFLSLHVSRAFYLEGSFNKINKFIFN